MAFSYQMPHLVALGVEVALVEFSWRNDDRHAFDDLYAISRETAYLAGIVRH